MAAGVFSNAGKRLSSWAREGVDLAKKGLACVEQGLDTLSGAVDSVRGLTRASMAALGLSLGAACGIDNEVHRIPDEQRKCFEGLEEPGVTAEGAALILEDEDIFFEEREGVEHLVVRFDTAFAGSSADRTGEEFRAIVSQMHLVVFRKFENGDFTRDGELMFQYDSSVFAVQAAVPLEPSSAGSGPVDEVRIAFVDVETADYEFGSCDETFAIYHEGSQYPDGKCFAGIHFVVWRDGGESYADPNLWFPTECSDGTRAYMDSYNN